MSGEAKIEAAKAACFEICSKGGFIDPENGCVGICKSVDECEGWHALIGFVSESQLPEAGQ